MSKKASDDGSRRLRRKHVELAERGLPSGGGARPFGYSDDGVTVVKAEAAMIGDAARRLLTGESLAAICRGWNETGKLTGSGSLWRVSTLRTVMISHRVAGLRAYKGDVVGEAAWAAILDRRTWEQVRAMLTDPSRRQDRPARASLLYGLARCGRCGAKLVVAPSQGRSCYRCQKGPGKAGCGGLAIVAEPFEEIVIEAVLQRFDSPAFAEALARAEGEVNDDDEPLETAATAESRLGELAAIWSAGEITRAEWLAARKPLEVTIEAARRKVSRTRRSAALDDVSRPGALRKVWPEMDASRRRAVLAAVLDRVEVDPARRGLNAFDANRLKPVWRA